MAHPDDAEILCGGTLALLAQKGWAVHIASSTPGDCGAPTLAADEIAAIRRKEGASAAGVIGGTYHCLEQRDLLVFYNEEGVRCATSLVRKLKPDIVITHPPVDYMLDHEETSKLARSACFNAPIPNAPTMDEKLPTADKIPHLYYADPPEGIDIFGREVQPSIVIDVTSVFETKIEMLSRHASQREWLREHHGIDEYLEACKRWSQHRGKFAGVKYGEGFRQHLGHAYPVGDLLGGVLGGKST